jgi:hypothetical protein
MKCPRCGLFNPDIAQRCDCGYDFETHTLQKAYVQQSLPGEIQTYVRLLIVSNVFTGLAALRSGEVSGVTVAAVWSVVVWWLYSQLVEKRNWARLALAVVSFPIGLLVLSPEVKLYCLQEDEGPESDELPEPVEEAEDEREVQ